MEREEQSEIPEPRCKSVGKPSGGRRRTGSPHLRVCVEAEASGSCV